MSSSSVQGQFLWHELLTTDPAAGGGFYSKVFGWNSGPWEGNADYAMLSGAKGPVGGARIIGKDPLADKVGLNWLTYVGVADLGAALAAVEAKGGRIVHPVTDVPGSGGRYAVIADPNGATIGVYQPGGGMSSGNAAAMAGPDAWHELTAEDPEAALRFYKDIFGWEVMANHEMGGDVGTYYIFGIGTTQMGGAFKRGAGSSRPRWLLYAHTPSVTAAAAATAAAGGKVLSGPHQVPGGNWVIQVTDSHGVHLAMHGPKEAAAKAPKAPAKPKPAAAAAPKAEVKPAAAKPAAKAKAKTKVKAKKKAKKAKKAKTQAKRKGAPKRKVAKSKVKARSKAKTKSRPKAKSKAKARKAPRRGK